MDKHDRLALEQAMEIAQRDPLRAKQLRAKLRDESWTAVAQFAAFSCQCESLHLEPWSLPPCRGDSEYHPDAAARKLLEQMLAAGVSRFAPDPLQALEAVK